jgi:hypothetical protein
MNVPKVEPEVIIPEGVGEENPDPTILSRFLFYMPYPNTTEGGIYVTVSDLEKLLKANKYSPRAIEYIADLVDSNV